MAAGSAIVLEQFWKLASGKPEDRVAATKVLLAELKGSVEETEGKGQGAGQEQRYVLNRLVKGLSSSRDGARQGYALALSQVRC
jgi:DNA polymerase phi